MGYYTVDYNDGSGDGFRGIVLGHDGKEKRFNTGDPLIDWYDFYKYVYSGLPKTELGTGFLTGSSSVDHYFMDQDEYIQKYMKFEDDKFHFIENFDDMSLGEIDECIKGVIRKDMTSWEEVRDYYKDYMKNLKL